MKSESYYLQFDLVDADIWVTFILVMYKIIHLIVRSNQLHIAKVCSNINVTYHFFK